MKKAEPRALHLVGIVMDLLQDLGATHKAACMGLNERFVVRARLHDGIRFSLSLRKLRARSQGDMWLWWLGRP